MGRTSISATSRALGAVVLAALAGPLAGGEAARLPPKLPGVCWEAGGRFDPGALSLLREAGATCLSQAPYGYQRRKTSPRVILLGHSDQYWGESDEGLLETARLARDAGIATILSPRIWLHDAWVGEVAMQSEDDWAAWFQSYEEFALHFAGIAEKSGACVYVIGTELGGTTHREKQWREVIRKVREVYHGPICYAANWDHEVESVPFWDALDCIGVQAYYPLSETAVPSVPELVSGWTEPALALHELSRRTGKPVLFTEVGYKSVEGTTARPWEWESSAAVSNMAQAHAYEAFFEVFWKASWVSGAFFWKWHPDGAGEREVRDFTPQGKPAMDVMRSWYCFGRP